VWASFEFESDSVHVRGNPQFFIAHSGVVSKADRADSLKDSEAYVKLKDLDNFY